MHYSQLHTDVQSSLESGSGDQDVLRVHLQGFIDWHVLEEHLEGLLSRVERHAPAAILCDLRAISGYDAAAPALAREWCMLVRRAGIQRVALVATSSVLRTHAHMLARDLDLDMRSFLGETEALRWLSSR